MENLKNTLNSQSVTWFGSPLAKYKVESKWINLINEITDQVFEKNNIRSNLFAQSESPESPSGNPVIPKILAEDFFEEMLKIAEHFHSCFANKSVNPEFRISSSWVTSMKQGEWNTLHRHEDQIAAVLYLKIPDDMGKITVDDGNQISGFGDILFSEGTPGLYRRSIQIHQPVVGDLYMFPSELAHTVYPFLCKDERRSLSFNVKVGTRKYIKDRNQEKSFAGRAFVYFN